MGRLSLKCCLLQLVLWTLITLSTCAPSNITRDVPDSLQSDADANGLQSREVKPFLLRIMPLGASITVGYHSSDGNGYRKWLRQQLRYSGWQVDMVGSLSNGSMHDNVCDLYFSQIHMISMLTLSRTTKDTTATKSTTSPKKPKRPFRNNLTSFSSSQFSPTFPSSQPH